MRQLEVFNMSFLPKHTFFFPANPHFDSNKRFFFLPTVLDVSQTQAASV